MKVLLMTGNHPRHNYLAALLKDAGLLTASVIEERETFVPVAPAELPQHIQKYFREHFEKRDLAEQEIFTREPVSGETRLLIKGDELNSEKVTAFIAEIRPDVIVTTGIGVIKKPVFECTNAQIWNIHGGLSPWYKGAITHFWPSYQLQPQYTGVTIHHVEPKIDAGQIIHQTPAVLQKGDGLHQLSGRSLKAGYEAIVPLLRKFESGGTLMSVAQKQTGKLWLKKDWTPFHLEMIYGFYNDAIVDLFLEGKLPQTLPALIQNNLA